MNIFKMSDAGLESERNDGMLVAVPKNFLLKNIILDKEHLYKEGLMKVDECLVEEIKDLWRMGIHTRGCCCGHHKQSGYIEVERTDIPKMLELGYEIFTEKDENQFDTFKPKSKCHCVAGDSEVVWEWPRLD